MGLGSRVRLAALALLLALPLAGCLTGGPERVALQVHDGFDLKRLTDTPGVREAQPAMSGDGRVVALTRSTAQGSEVWALELVTGRLARLSAGPGDRDHAPTVSRDGDLVAWVTQQPGNSAIAASRSDGSGWHLLTRDRDRSADPALSPDGTEVAFVTTRWGNPELVVARTDGTGERRLTENRVPEFQPVFSRDGQRIAYLSYPAASKVYIVDAGGGEPRRVTDEGQNVAFPDLDASGRSVAWVMGPAGEREVWLLGPGGLRRLTDNFVDEWTPRVTSDGARVVFRSQGAAGATQHVIQEVLADGTGLTTLARGQDFAMSADGRRIAVVAEDDLWLLTRR
jgi:TolB protein